MVAVKTLTFQDQGNVIGDKGRNTAIMEAAISSSMSHPNVVATYYHEIKPMKVEGMEGAETAGMIADWKLYIVQARACLKSVCKPMQRGGRSSSCLPMRVV